MKPIVMVDLQRQYERIRSEVLQALESCMNQSTFIGGEPVERFAGSLGKYLKVKHTITCANGTDALQLAMMALDLQPGDEVIVPAFTYIATAEVIGLLRLTPVLVDVDPLTFNVTAANIRPAITERTRVIVPVHLFGQCCDMEPILTLAKNYDLKVIEDNAQALGATYTLRDGSRRRAGTMGHIGCTSFYPSKNLGAYGDGGALFTEDDRLAAKLRSIANHGQSTRRYYHELIGVNSRLDAMQASILDIKLRRLDEYTAARQKAADAYDKLLSGIDAVKLPERSENSTHVFHQYTLRVPAERRDALKDYLQSKGIPSMIYYPVPLHEQPAFRGLARRGAPDYSATEMLCKSVLSLPMHSELDQEQIEYVAAQVAKFFGR